jgi:hypothetical protein
MGKHQIALQALHVIPSTDQGRASYSLGHRQLSKKADGLSTVGQHYQSQQFECLYKIELIQGVQLQ